MTVLYLFIAEHSWNRVVADVKAGSHTATEDLDSYMLVETMVQDDTLVTPSGKCNGDVALCY